MSYPKVSILIPCYNAEQWIYQAIQSALQQDYPNKEVLVLDDGSVDRSLEIIRSFGDSIRWETGPNRGGNRARNRLFELSQGTWLQYLDADDYLLPTKISNQLKFLASAPGCDVVYGPSVIEEVRPESVTRELLPIPEPHDPWILLARWHLPQTGSPLWRKQAVDEVGRWKEDQPCCQEHELYLRLLKAGKRFCYHEEAGSVYRLWSQDTVCRKDKPEVRRRRLQIEAAAEDHLRSCGELTPARLWAINMARFEMARSAWPTDRQEARRIFRSLSPDPGDFLPEGAAAPAGYRLAYRLFGFAAAERLASLRRSFVKAG